MFSKKKRILYVLCCFVSIVSSTLLAQNITTRASIQPLEMPIGQQAVLQIDVMAPKSADVIFPIYQDTLVKGLEVLAPIGIDTTYTDGMKNLSLKYIITAFDTAIYHVPYIPVIVNNDTLKTNDLALKVTSPELTEATLAYIKEFTENPKDTIPNFEKLGITDIKSIIEPPFVWQDYLLYILLGLLIFMLLVVIILVIILMIRKKKKDYLFKPKVVLPTHIIALSQLDVVKNEKLWQQGREKAYYTSLTDILREYIGNRFDINAFEMTSDEILSTIKYLIENDSSLQALKQILQLSDLVKFAKYRPLPNENDLSIVNAYLFINQTKKENLAPDQNLEDDQPKTDSGNKKKEKLEPNKASSDKEEDIDWTIKHDNNTPIK